MYVFSVNFTFSVNEVNFFWLLVFLMFDFLELIITFFGGNLCLVFTCKSFSFSLFVKILVF